MAELIDLQKLPIKSAPGAKDRMVMVDTETHEMSLSLPGEGSGSGGGSASITVDSELNAQSTNPIQNKAVAERFEQIENANSISDNKNINACIKSIFINTNKENNLTISLYRWHKGSHPKGCLFFIKKNGQSFAKFDIQDTATLEINKPYALTINDGSEDFGYVVFGNLMNESIEISSIIKLNKDIYLYYNRNSDYNNQIIEALIDLNIPKIKNWCNYADYNNCIEELYIPDLTKLYGSNCKITRVFSTKDKMCFFLKKEDGRSIVCLCARDVTPFYYESEAITTIHDYQDKRIIGYIKIRYGGGDFKSEVISNISHRLVEDLNNSPKIKAMLESRDQVIIAGDSLPGQPSENPLPDIMRGILHKKVWNIACGGCRMSLRTPDGNNYYDKFSFTKIVDSLCLKDFSEQKNALDGRSDETDYRYQYGIMKQINLDIPTVLLCTYVNNDLTGNVEIGDLWNYNDSLESFNKNTFLGSMNYGIQKLLNKYPFVKVRFLTPSYRFRLNSDGNNVPPYLYKNGIGKSDEDYVTAEMDNCKRLGLRCYDFKEYGVRNAFSLGTGTSGITVDGSHHNAVGFQELAIYFAQLTK